MKTNNSCTAVLTAGLLAGCANGIPPEGTCRVYFGTQAKGDQRGIYMALLDAKTGQLSEPTRVNDAIRPGFIQIHPDGKHLYATEASGRFQGALNGAVSAYRITEPDGILEDLNTQPSGGLGPCHISIDSSDNYLLVANYREGSCAVLPILPNGTLGAPTAIRRHSGSGPNLKRQEAAHTHSINSSPDGRFALVADLGMDQIMIYRLENGSLIPNGPPFIKTAPGSGPRHLTFSPDGKFVYACMELNGTVSAYEYEEGRLTELQTLPTLPDDFDGENTTSEVCRTPNGRFLYVGNRGHESLAIFEVDSETGKLTALGHEPTRGKHPRHFNIDPSGNFMLIANAFTDNVVVFRINQQTGQLNFTGSEINVPVATCIQFLTAQTN